MPRWGNVGISGNSGTQAMGLAGDLFNKAVANAQGGLTKHEETMAQNAQKQSDANTAELLKMAAEGKKPTQAQMDKMGMYDGQRFNEQMLKIDARNDARAARSQAAALAASKPSWLQKEKMKIALGLEKQKQLKEGGYGTYATKVGANGGSEAGKLMEEIGLTVETKDNKGETIYGNIDEDNNLLYQSAINKAIAAGATKKQLRNALSRNTSVSNWTSNFTGQDEKGLNVAGFLSDFNLK